MGDGLKKHNKILVLMATYNGEKYLREQIDSLLCQENVDIKILVRDDGSTDGTIGILNEYQNNKKLNWFSGERLGVTKSFFQLLRKAEEADYYAFCDQDDVWDADKLFSAIVALNSITSDNFSLYCCGSRLVDENLNFICNHYMDVCRTQYARLFFAGVAGNTIVINKKLRDKVIQYEPHMAILHDAWVYNLALCLGANIVIDKNPHLNYRQHGNNTVGMELNIKQKTGKFINIIKERTIYPHLMEIKEVYCSEIIPEYNELLSKFALAKKNIKYRINLAFDKRIDFNNFFFNLSFKIKILFGSF